MAKYTLTDIDDIQREANARIIKETSEWFPDQNVKYFLVSTAQVRHILEAAEWALAEKMEEG